MLAIKTLQTKQTTNLVSYIDFINSFCSKVDLFMGDMDQHRDFIIQKTNNQSHALKDLLDKLTGNA